MRRHEPTHPKQNSRLDQYCRNQFTRMLMISPDERVGENSIKFIERHNLSFEYLQELRKACGV